MGEHSWGLAEAKVFAPPEKVWRETLALDNNPAERALRCVAIGRKNYLFAGSDAGGRRAAALYSLIESAKLNGLNPQLAPLSSPLGWQSVDDFLDRIKLSNAIERFFGDRRTGGGVNIKEFAPHMRPATGLDNPAAGEQFIEPGIAIGVNDAAEVLQMRLRMLAFAVGRVEEQRRRLP